MPNQNFLTRGRLALIDRLQANSILAAAIKETSWFLFGRGLKERLSIEPARCPFCAVQPAENRFDQITNAFVLPLPQIIQVDLGVEGPDVEPLEELLVALYDVVLEANEDSLDLVSEGLSRVHHTGTLWQAWPDPKGGADLVWTVTTNVWLSWARRRPLT